MPELTEFEEKEYENPLNHQLLMQSNNLWTPGQVFEKIFGIDAAIMATDITFWQLFGGVSAPIGVSLNNYQWNFLFRFANRLKKFPSFKVNLLIQAKRPYYRLGKNASYASNGIKNDYWQFQVTPHQQKILEHLESKLGNNAMVVYACPSFHKFLDLENHITNGQLVNNSTFVKPSNLKGHSKWVYDRPGTVGLGCSKIEKHEDVPFEQQLANLYSLVADVSTNQTDTSQINNAIVNLSFLERTAFEICTENSQSNAYADVYLSRRQRVVDLFLSISNSNQNTVDLNAVRSFVLFQIFASTMNVNWITI